MEGGSLFLCFIKRGFYGCLFVFCSVVYFGFFFLFRGLCLIVRVFFVVDLISMFSFLADRLFLFFSVWRILFSLFFPWYVVSSIK